MNDIELSRATTALIIIDLQRGIVAQQSAPHPAATVVTRAAELAKRFRKAGALVVYVHVNLANMIRPIADIPFKIPGSSPPDPTDSELVEEAGGLPDDLLITKRSRDAFVGTDLEHQLRARGILSVVLCGISTDAGVESTARTAAALGFALVVVEDITSSSSGEEAHRYAITKTFPSIGRVRTASQLRIT